MIVQLSRMLETMQIYAVGNHSKLWEIILCKVMGNYIVGNNRELYKDNNRKHFNKFKYMAQ